MNTAVATPALGPLGRLLPRLITSCFAIFTWAWWWWLLEVQVMVSSISPSSEQTPNLKLSSGGRNTGMLFSPHNTCLWICYMVKFQLCGIDEANTTTTMKWSQKHKNLHQVLLCDFIWQRREAQKMGSSLVYWVPPRGCKCPDEC